MSNIMEKDKRYAFFDLDGTLIDSSEGIVNSVAYALKKLGYEVPGSDSLREFIGPPLKYSFETFYGMNDAQAAEAIDAYREVYSVKGLLEVKLYDGILRLFERLKAADIEIVLATSKPHIYADEILYHLDIRKYFTFVSGSELDGFRNKKSDVIRHAIDHLSIRDVKNIIMVGDRKYDISGATEVGIDTIAVLYGFGNREEFEEFGAKYIVETADEVGDTIINKWLENRIKAEN